MKHIRNLAKFIEEQEDAPAYIQCEIEKRLEREMRFVEIKDEDIVPKEEITLADIMEEE